MDGSEIASSTVKWLAQGYMVWKLRVLERKALAGDLTVEELKNSDSRFALYMRVGRAFEICSEREVVDFISDAMIGSIKLGDIDSKPDLPQMAISALAGLTNTELNLILLLRKHDLWGRTTEEIMKANDCKEFYTEASEMTGLTSLSVVALLNSMTKTGLVTPQAGGLGSELWIQGNKLTILADELFRYVDHSRRLTQ